MTKNAISTDINITIPNEETSSEVSSCSESSCSKQSESACECSQSSADHSQAVGSKMKADASTAPKSSPKPKPYEESLEERKRLIEEFRAQPKSIAIDTRISDRIKQRQFKVAEPDYCDSLPAEPKSTGKDPLELSSDDCVCTKINSSCPCKTSKSTAVQTEDKFTCKCKQRPNSLGKAQKASRQNDEIPVKPAVKLRATNEEPVPASVVSSAYDSQKVPHYDFSNRFVSERLSSVQVEKIDAGSLEVSN